MTDSNPSRVVEQARDALAAFVREAPEGTKLPPERQLAQQLGVSRTTLRDGVSRLALLGLLEVRHGDGTYVRSPTAAQLAPLLRPLIEGRGASVDDLLELKRLLEPSVAERAALNCSDVQAVSLRAAVQRERDELSPSARTPRRTARRAAIQRTVDELLADAAGDSLIVALVAALNELLGPQVAAHLTPAQKRLAVEQRSAIVEAVIAGEPEAARDATELYLTSLARALPHRSQAGDPASGRG